MHLPAHCTALLSAKTSLGLTFAEISTALQKPEVWTTALFFGQAACDASTAQKLLQTLKMSSQYSFEGEDGSARTISDEVVVKGLTGAGTGVQGMVQRGGTWDGVPKVTPIFFVTQDPVLYRLYEVLVVYGWSYKALIQEKFGDGIMSAIDFRTSLTRKPDPKGDRVVITLDGKFLPYSPTEAWDK